MVRARTLTFLTAVALAVALAMATTWAVAPPGGPTEGIGVHGHWTIDVHDADGALVASREFDNAFTGGDELADVMAGARSMTTINGVPDWAIRATTVPGEQPCLSSTGVAGHCVISQPGSQHGGQSDDLTVSSSGATTTIQGSFSADVDGRISSVETLLRYDTTASQFTHTNLDTTGSTATTDDDQVFVTAGQFVTVTVDISFADAPA